MDTTSFLLGPTDPSDQVSTKPGALQALWLPRLTGRLSLLLCFQADSKRQQLSGFRSGDDAEARTERRELLL